MGQVLITAPTLEPLTVREAEKHLRIDASSKEPTPPAPTVALAGAGAGNVDNGAHRYRATFVTADGETEGGDISAAVTVADKAVNGQVSVTAIPLGGSHVTQRKLYRTAAGGSTYLLLTTIANNTATTYTDNIADAALGAAAPTTNTTEDPEVRSHITAARQLIEADGLALVTQTWDYTRDGFPSDDDVIRLPRRPVASVSSVKYIDTAGAEQTMPVADYIVDTGKIYGEIALAYDKTWPLTRDQKNAVTVRFISGYGTPAAVPEPIKSAMKLILGDLHANRVPGEATWRSVDRLLSPYYPPKVA